MEAQEFGRSERGKDLKEVLIVTLETFNCTIELKKRKIFFSALKGVTHLCTYGCVYYKSEVERRMTHLAQLLKHLKGKGSQQTVSEK